MNIDTIISIFRACSFFLGKHRSRSFADLNVHITLFSIALRMAHR